MKPVRGTEPRTGIRARCRCAMRSVEIPGTKVLQFAFDGTPQTRLFIRVPRTTLRTGWYDTLPEDQRRNLWYTNCHRS
jgi:hypothetical protein